MNAIALDTAQSARLLRLATYASVVTAAVLIAGKVAAWLMTGSVSVMASLVDSMLDAAALRGVVEAEKPHLIVPEVEAIATETLLALEQEGYQVIPTARATRLTMDREGIRRLAAEDLGLKTSAYRFADTREEFDALFTDDLYFKISRHAIEMAHQIRDIFVSAGYPLLFDSPTNQQYPIMPDDELAEIGKSFGYEYWERVDETHSGVRFCASWATTQENVDALRAAVQALKK